MTPGNPKQPRVYDLVTAVANYQEWQGRPSRSVLICTQQRSGSTLLGEAIYFGGGLGCPLEYFHVGFRPGFEARWASKTFRDYTNLAERILGADALTASEPWHTLFLTAPSLSIRGGTDEIQRNIVGERVLGLGEEPRVDRALPFDQLPRSSTR